jgi:hypothetical protein
MIRCLCVALLSLLVPYEFAMSAEVDSCKEFWRTKDVTASAEEIASKCKASIDNRKTQELASKATGTDAAGVDTNLHCIAFHNQARKGDVDGSFNASEACKAFMKANGTPRVSVAKADEAACDHLRTLYPRNMRDTNACARTALPTSQRTDFDQRVSQCESVFGHKLERTKTIEHCKTNAAKPVDKNQRDVVNDADVGKYFRESKKELK